ncbi:MAG: hypothetical protein KIT11_09875 [Fimbriimonadaceae bacterium]|nr:hypothetical protein [Fimbriimonadaceae bacterium]QYK55632.1 MAG: hypothetical protein KF733_11545 [Fimbriimonadaceae bacterium]
MLSLLFLFISPQEQIQLKPPMSKVAEKQKFHFEKVAGTSVGDRERSFEERRRMVGSSPFRQVPWRSIGPEVQGGRVIDIDSPRNRPEETLVAFATGGLWRTRDDGGSWQPLFDGQDAFGIGDFSVSDDGQTIWVGTGENNSQRTSYAGFGVYKSIDGGTTWRNMGLRDSHHIGRVAVNPKNPKVVFVASIGPLYSDGGERGLFVTKDGGETWRNVLPGGEDTGCIDVCFKPGDPRTVYATTWERERRAWNFREGGPGTAVYRSTDGGENWEPIFKPQEDWGRVGLAVSPAKPDRLYVFVDNQEGDTEYEDIDELAPAGTLTLRRFLRMSKEEFLALDASIRDGFLERNLPSAKRTEAVKDFKDGKLTMEDLANLIQERNPNAMTQPLREAQLWVSDDSGATWRNPNQGRRIGSHGGYYWGKVFADPKNADIVYTLGVLLLRSSDAGKSWQHIAQRTHVDHHVVYTDPRDTRKMWLGNDGGLYRSLDGGGTWRHIENLAVGQTTTLAIDDKPIYNVYVGLQDNGTLKGPSNYRAGIDDPSRWTSIGGGDGSAIAIDPRGGGDTVYIASQFGAHQGLNQTNNQRWSARAANKPGEPELRYNWISPITVSTHHPDIIYLGSQKLHRSFNQGKKYDDISPDLTKNREQGDVPFSTLTAISESPLRFGLIYIGCDDGNVKMTPDGGYQWVDIPTPQPNKWVTRIVASQYDEQKVYLSQNGYREDDFRPYVWKSTDAGKTWQSIAAGLPLDCVNTVREDPVVKGMLWVGTDMGVYVSRDDGATWQPFGVGMPNAPVHDLAIHPKAHEIVAATHSRSVWVASLDLVHKLTEKITAEPVYIWPIDDMSRSERWGFPRGEWDSATPDPPQLSISFWSSGEGPATIEVADEGKKNVLTKSVDAIRGLNFVKVELQTAPGDPFAPRNPDAKGTDDPFAARRPSYLPPGKYKVTVTGAWGTAQADWNLTGRART